ncbi:N-acetylmuramoyl-L-alanine amidase [Lachnospiraceae bacterium KM106-2]|nr:N-acetylmuramoyl-L-alanine amidase [Lachnospiraceae bacterium KM106-2]
MKQLKSFKVLVSVILCSMLVLTGCMQEKTVQVTEQGSTAQAGAKTTSKGTLKVHFIDVGQGDSILLQSSNQVMLIDAGDNQHGNVVVNYLKKQGIKKIDHLIGTHPDADHIGGLDNVIQSFSIGKLYMPKVQSNTKTFEDVLLAAKAKKLKITAPKVNSEISIGGAKAKILGPINTYEDTNNNSIVIRVTHQKKAFLFEGDAELDEEWDILNSKANLKSDVIKIGHHGSHTSSMKKYLQAVNPKVAIISCGAGNKYGHPHVETTSRLNVMKVKTYRTDQVGTIIAISNGKKITYKTAKTSPTVKETKAPAATKKPTSTKKPSGIYIGNKNTKKFHTSTCSSLPIAKNRVKFSSRKQAINSGYKPCKLCNP